MINSFRDEYRFLSNFWIEEDGYTVEHHYQAEKAVSDEEYQWVLESRTPGEAKRRGRKVNMVPDWDYIKNRIMLDLVRAKFQNPGLKSKLLATGDQELVEGNHWGDTYWGVCNGVGQNKLGKILMKVREELRND